MSNPGEVKVELSVPQVMKATYWGLLGLGVLLILLGFGSKEYGLLVTACFFGIAARVVQAEFHYTSAPRQG